MEKTVLQKYLADAGIDSRRKCADLISQGKVRVYGRVATLGARVTPGKDLVTVNGKRVEPASSKKIYIMLHKPRGYVTTMHDERGRKCVTDLVKEIKSRIYPVGRLDKDSEGLLIMTNDGDFANNLIHPSKNIFKTYRVTVRSGVKEETLVKLACKTEIDGEEIEPAQVEVLSNEKGRSVLKISIKEGKNRQIRKMCESVGLEVARLKRISIGQLKLGMLPPGKWRELTPEELKHFKKIKAPN